MSSFSSCDVLQVTFDLLLRLQLVSRCAEQVDLWAVFGKCLLHHALQQKNSGLKYLNISLLYDLIA